MCLSYINIKYQNMGSDERLCKRKGLPQTHLPCPMAMSLRNLTQDAIGFERRHQQRQIGWELACRLNVKTPTAKADPSSFQTSPLPTPGVKVLNGRTRYRSWVQVLDLCLLSLLVVGFSDLARLGRETQLMYSRLHAIECKLIEPH